MIEDYGLHTLLDMHGFQFTLENGYWWKIEAYLVQKNHLRPHGIRYNLTLYNQRHMRVLVMDNSRSIKPTTKEWHSGKLTLYNYGSIAQEKTFPYEFTSAEQLLSDFFANTDRIIYEKNRRDK